MVCFKQLCLSHTPLYYFIVAIPYTLSVPDLCAVRAGVVEWHVIQCNNWLAEPIWHVLSIWIQGFAIGKHETGTCTIA